MELLIILTGAMAAMATEAGVAAASTAAVGFGLFNYNRLSLKNVFRRMHCVEFLVVSL